MELRFAPRGILEINDARIIFRNFRGLGDRFNREGDRNFYLIIPDMETAQLLMNDFNRYGVGWNVQIKPPKEEGMDPYIKMKVKVKFSKNTEDTSRDRGPFIYLVTNGHKVRLDEETVGCLDTINISKVNLDIRPYDDEINGKPFRAAYLHALEAYQDISDRFAEEEYPEE